MGEFLARYTVGEIETYFIENPDFFDTKRGYETLTGLILAKCHHQIHDSEAVVGFELKGSYREDGLQTRPSLRDLFSKGLLVDRDADVCVINEVAEGRFEINRIQVTRLEERGRGGSPSNRLVGLIRKKSLVQPDSYLQLAVLIDEPFELDYVQLTSLLTRQTVPYGRINLVGQYGDPPQPDIFWCMQVYPELLKSEPIMANINQVL